MRNRVIVPMILGLLLAAPAAAQLAAPLNAPPLGGTIGGVAGDVTGTIGRAAGALDAAATTVAGGAANLAAARLDRLADFVRRNADVVERDARGDPARKAELLLTAPGAADLAAARAAGFTVLGEERLGELKLSVVRLGVPQHVSLRKAQAQLARLLPEADISADTLLFQAGSQLARPQSGGSGGQPGALLHTPIDAKVGVIDGAPGRFAAIGEQRGFASGAPFASNHGSAVVSLLQLAGVRRIAVADVYGSDRAGGNALAVARGLDWLVGTGARIVSISLVGPSSALLGRAIGAAQAKGVVVVSAVGNDGPAAPPAYPASYGGVLAVTGVDGRDRPLIEAGRALHLDYAAPGADMLAADARGAWVRVRGTSFATPLVAARAAAALDARTTVIASLDREAQRIGHAPSYGRGLLCGICRRTR